ncbi:hypothetical protein EDC01DRAFT_733217 [Geopyxis carbonaria]|nr:hypothetical protein EDC01DRAFT_733217 [Geopyxis carbonaria]
MKMSPAIFQRRGSDGSDSSMSSHGYDLSSRGTVPSSLPSLDHRYNSVDSRFDTPQESLFESNSRASLNTYCTTVDTFSDDFAGDDEAPYYSSAYAAKPAPQIQAVPATPAQFAEVFPSTRRLTIKHDDSTFDGNMNLRVDTDIPSSRKGEADKKITLFHVRMYDLRDRDFSVRRYGRDCGREVAHVKRKMMTPARPRLQRSVSKAVQSFMGGEFGKPSRTDSGYISGEEDDEPAEEPKEDLKATNSCTLEFSNYAHVDLERKGGNSNKKYDFEYWGNTYSWKRTVRMEGCIGEEASFQLVNNTTHNVVALIRPDALTPQMALAEEARGGFIAPCSLFLQDHVQDPINQDRADVADVIVTTGLVALIDDTIKRKYHKKRSVQLTFPSGGKHPLKMNMEYVGPRRFIDEMFTRRPTLSRSQSANVSRAQTPQLSPPSCRTPTC